MRHGDTMRHQQRQQPEPVDLVIEIRGGTKDGRSHLAHVVASHLWVLGYRLSEKSDDFDCLDRPHARVLDGIERKAREKGEKMRTVEIRSDGQRRSRLQSLGR